MDPRPPAPQAPARFSRRGPFMKAVGTFLNTRLQELGQTRLVTIFKIKELRQKIFITALFLAIYRIGYHVPLPMIDQARMAETMKGYDEGILGFISMFS